MPAYPFTKTTLITFMPKYKIFNHSKSPIFIYQENCEESICLDQNEKNIFHWTDYKKKRQIRVRYDEYNVSGPFFIDKAGEMHIRLKNNYENSLVILKVTITEVGGTYLIEFFDSGFIPPYRIENMTKHDLLISQVKSKTEDNDTVHSYKILDYALSYPMNDKTIKIYIKSNMKQNHITEIKLDSFKTSEEHIILDKKRKVDLNNSVNPHQAYVQTSYIISISRENDTKVIRIREEHTVDFDNKHSNRKNDAVYGYKNPEFHNEITRGLELIVVVPKFGVSLVNSSAVEEIAYVYFKNTMMFIENTKDSQKFKIEIGAIQIDDQMMKNEKECMVLKKNSNEDTNVLSFNYCLLNNQGFENIIYFKEF
jgi:hypothetical protein